jgi:ABC-type lipoprotein release transport system permease subunit
VRSKTRDIGILRALGATEGGVLSVFLTSGGLCGLVGSAFGISLGLLLACNVNEISDFIRVVSREISMMAYRVETPPSRVSIALAAVGLLASAAAIIWTWLVVYKERLNHPWVRILVGILTLGVAAALVTAWLPSYRPVRSHDPALDVDGRWKFVFIVVFLWTILVVAWRVLNRWRRRPSWILFGFGVTMVLSAILLVVGATLMTAVWILIAQPGPDWPGLELFPIDIYYLERIPVYVNYNTLGFFVGMTLLVSLIFSVYPALKAAACNPIDAIREE